MLTTNPVIATWARFHNWVPMGSAFMRGMIAGTTTKPRQMKWLGREREGTILNALVQNPHLPDPQFRQILREFCWKKPQGWDFLIRNLANLARCDREDLTVMARAVADTGDKVIDWLDLETLNVLGRRKEMDREVFLSVLCSLTSERRRLFHELTKTEHQFPARIGDWREDRLLFTMMDNPKTPDKIIQEIREANPEDPEVERWYRKRRSKGLGL